MLEVRAKKEADLDLVVKTGAIFLDGLYRLAHSRLSLGEFDLLQSRLRKIPGYIDMYLVEIQKNAQDIHKDQPSKTEVETS